MPSAYGHRPRKRFGQNFLTDAAVAQRIVDACRLAPNDRVLEIGPGRGALTAPLLERVPALQAIELDRDLAAGLRGRWPTLVLHEGDALRFDYATLLAAGDWSIVGNLPYNISTPLLLRLLRHVRLTRQMLFMLQQEVVERMCAGPGSKTYGRLSVMVGFYCHAEPLFGVAPGSFQPVPKVRSRMIRLTPQSLARTMPAALPEIVRRAFSQRRKTLRNGLAGLLSPAQMQAQDIDPGCRPETLSIAEFVRLAEAVEGATKVIAMEQEPCVADTRD